MFVLALHSTKNRNKCNLNVTDIKYQRHKNFKTISDINILPNQIFFNAFLALLLLSKCLVVSVKIFTNILKNTTLTRIIDPQTIKKNKSQESVVIWRVGRSERIILLSNDGNPAYENTKEISEHKQVQISFYFYKNCEIQRLNLRRETSEIFLKEATYSLLVSFV